MSAIGVFMLLCTKRTSRARSEQGAVLVLGIFLVILFLALGALMIDLVRIERSILTIQTSVDASSLAGALVLRPAPSSDATQEERELSLLRWRAAKVAVFESLAVNPLFAESSSLDPLGCSECCVESPELTYDSDPSWQCVVFGFPMNPDPAVTLRIERGIYYTDPIDGQRRFFSLEGVADCCQVDQCSQVVPACTSSGQELNAPRVANGVRVEITQARVATVLARIFSFSSTQVSRSATSAQSAYPPN